MEYSDSNFFDKNSNSIERSGLLSNIAASKNMIMEGQILFNRPFLEEIVEQCLNNRRFKSASAIVSGLLKVFPYDASLWHKKSICMLEIKDYVRASRCLRKAIRLDPVNIDYQLSLATLFLATGKKSRANEIFEKIQCQSPADFELYNQIGDIYIAQNEYHVALEFFYKMLELQPGSPDALFNIAICLEYIEDYPAALEAYDRYLLVETHCAVGWYNKGIVLEQLKKHMEAIDCYRCSITVDESFPDAWFNLGNLYADIDDYNQAIDCFKKVINLESNHSGAYYNLGILYEDLHDYKQAIYFYSKSLQLNKSFQEAYLGRGNCFSLIHDLENALQDFQSALAYNDTPEAAWNIPASRSEISIDEVCLQKIRSYESRGTENLSTLEFSDLIQNYIAIGRYEAAIALISCHGEESISSQDIFLLAKIHFMRKNNFLGYLYLNKSFYINKELIEIFSKMFPKVMSSRLFNELFGFKK